MIFTPGLGIVYSTESYFENKNPLVGSHLNIALQAGAKVFFAITPSTGIQAGIDLFHYSNGGVRVPNNGINSLNISLGIVQNINKTSVKIAEQPFQNDYKNSFEFGGIAGMRGAFQSKNELYRATIYAGYAYRLNPVLSLKGGLDAGYYFTVYNPKNNLATFEGYGTSYDRWSVGASLGADLWLGRLAVMGSYGYYLYFNSYYHNKTYWTPGLKYNVLPWMVIQVKSYIHNHQADFLGVGLLFAVH